MTLENNFDWVKARSDCSLGTIFELLKMKLQEDVDKRQGLRRGPPFDYGFKLVINDSKGVSVVKEGVGDFHGSVLFRLTDSAIEVVDENGMVRFTATPAIDDEGQCRLTIGGKQRELWHLRKMALEEIFFQAS